MKKFNTQISIEVEVDAIANKLLLTFDKENPHAEMMTETIIESMLHSKHVHYLYNNLNGWTNELDFKVNQLVNCSATHYGYQALPTGENTETLYKHVSYKIGAATIRSINIFKTDDVGVEFTGLDSKGEKVQIFAQVNHTSLSAIPEETK